MGREFIVPEGDCGGEWLGYKEVVRCKDCKYWNGEYCCDFMTTYKNAFCYWGERREE